MPKVPVEIIADVLTNNEFDSEMIEKIIKDIEHKAQVAAEEEKAGREPTVKKQLVIVVSDPRGTLPEEDYVGWVAQIPEDDSPGVTLERLVRASYEYNISKKGSKHPVKSIGEACEAVGTKFLKEQGLAIRTKMPVTVLKTDNKIPEIESDLG